jgi:hypothetical protein
LSSFSTVDVEPKRKVTFQTKTKKKVNQEQKINQTDSSATVGGPV